MRAFLLTAAALNALWAMALLAAGSFLWASASGAVAVFAAAAGMWAAR